MKIVTHYDPKPIPVRDFDWTANLEGYDPGEPDEEGTYRGGDPLGFGSTEAEAVADLMAQLADREDAE